MSDSGNTGAFVPTNFIWEVSQVEDINVNSEEFKELLVRLYQNLNIMQLTLNIKDSGYYNTDEFVNGQLFFEAPNSETAGMRQVFRKVVNFGALPNSTSKSVAHNLTITSGYSFTRIYGSASDTTNKKYIPIPNASTDINIEVDATNVKITTSGTFSTYTITYVVLEYLKQ